MKSRIGRTSLLIAVGGFIATELGIHMEILQGAFWRILATGFEAGTIGALADWFAVSALFHTIPIPVISKHTNIIAKNRHKLTEAIVELVTTKWLSFDVIYQKLQGIGMADGMLKMLQHPKNMRIALDLSRHLLQRFVDHLDNPRVLLLFRNMLKKQIQAMDIAIPLGSWLESLVLAKGHHAIIDRLLKESSKALDDPSAREMVQEKLKMVLESYEKKDLIKKAVVKIGRWTKGIDIDLLTDRLLEMAQVMAFEAESNPGHPLRQKLDQSILDLASRLKNGDPSTLASIDSFKEKVSEDQQLQQMLLAALRRVKAGLYEELSDNNTVLMGFVKTKAEQLIKELRSDAATLLEIDHWMKETIAGLINKYHHEVGTMVRESLLKLDDEELVLQIKDKVGDDLQYIRLNGAVVGGLVGVFIAIARIVFLQ